MKLYIAGAILNAPGHTNSFQDAEERLRLFGYEAVNPTKVESCSDLSCWSRGHRLSPWKDGDVSDSGKYLHTYECYIRFDLIEMLLCEGVAYTDGWETSFGARNEINQAAMCGMPVKSLDQWIALAEANTEPECAMSRAQVAKANCVHMWSQPIEGFRGCLKCPAVMQPA